MSQKRALLALLGLNTLVVATVAVSPAMLDAEALDSMTRSAGGRRALQTWGLSSNVSEGLPTRTQVALRASVQGWAKGGPKESTVSDRWALPNEFFQDLKEGHGGLTVLVRCIAGARMTSLQWEPLESARRIRGEEALGATHLVTQQPASWRPVFRWNAGEDRRVDLVRSIPEISHSCTPLPTASVPAQGLRQFAQDLVGAEGSAQAFGQGWAGGAEVQKAFTLLRQNLNAHALVRYQQSHANGVQVTAVERRVGDELVRLELASKAGRHRLHASALRLPASP